MYQEELNLKQGSAPKRFGSLKNVYELHKSSIWDDILSDIKQN
jgi:hypothetical protein